MWMVGEARALYATYPGGWPSGMGGDHCSDGGDCSRS